MEDIVQQLKKIQHAAGMRPSAAWVADTRSELLRHAAATKMVTPVVSEPVLIRGFHAIRGAVSVFVPTSMTTALRPVATFLLIVAVTVSGWITSVSASYSVPGDVLYNVKIAAEKTQVAVATVAGSNEWKAQLHLKFAGERAREAKEVVDKNVPESNKQVETAMDSLNKSIVAASDSIKTFSNEQPEKAIELLKDANQKTDEIVNTLNEVTKGAAAAGDTDLTKKVVETTNIVNEASLSTVEVVVQKQTEGATTVAPQDIKNLVEKKIDTAIQAQKVAGEAIAQVQINASSTVSSVLAASSTLAAPVLSDAVKLSTAVSSSTLTAASSTVVVPASPVVISQTVEQAVQKVSQTTAVVDGAVKEAKDFVQNNQLLEAIQKVKEATVATKEAKQAVVEAQQIVNSALPAPTPAAPVADTGTTTAAPKVDLPKTPDTATSPTPKTTTTH